MHNFDPSQTLKFRVRLEISSGTGESIADYDVNRELVDVLGGFASPETEKMVLDFLQRDVLNGARALVRARMAKDQFDDSAHYARNSAPFDLPDGVDESLASLAECLRLRSY